MSSSTRTHDDSHAARILPACPEPTREILQAAWDHDLPTIKSLLDAPGKASLQEPTTGETPLHAAIRSPKTETHPDAAREAVQELLLWGGIWNDVDDHDETPGCVALRLGRQDLYNLCVEAGARAEMLFGVLEGYEALSSGSEADEEGEEEAMHVEVDTSGMTAELQDGDDAPELVTAEVQEFEQALEELAAEEPTFNPPKVDPEAQVKSEKYLRSKLTYSDGKLVDASGNGVMMAWETEIMRRSVDALLSTPNKPGKRILNIGFGMGIIDSMFAATAPSRHHIIEAHDEVLTHLDEPDSKFGKKWEASGPTEGAYAVHRGRWQDVIPTLLKRGEVYDAVYFDTFGEDYSQLRKFFTEYIPGLLDQEGIFGFFNGLGADRQICYDVYTKVVEFHLTDAGLDVNWQEIDVDLHGLEEAGKGEWEGVKRRYWTLHSEYSFPNLCVAFCFSFLYA